MSGNGQWETRSGKIKNVGGESVGAGDKERVVDGEAERVGDVLTDIGGT